MKIIKHIIEIDLGDGNLLLVNGLSGAVDRMHGEELAIYLSWKGQEAITLKTEKETALFDQMVARKYIMEADAAREYRQKLIDKLLERQNLSLSANTAWFVLSYNCNFACPYCYEQDNEQGKVMTQEMVDAVFAINPSLKEVGFFGGEPLLPAHRELIEYIIEKSPADAAFSVITNGYYLEEYVELFARLKVGFIQVTLDGTEELHNQTRCLRGGQPTYRKILSGVKACAERGLPVTIRMNLSKENQEACFREKELLQQTEWGKKLRFELQPVFQTQPKERDELYDAMFADSSTDPYGKNKILEKMSVLSNFLYNNEPMHPVLKACDSEGQGRFYDCEGNIYSCILAVGKEEKSIGRYFPREELKENSFLTRNITRIEQCSDCPAALICGGGCPNGLRESCNLFSPNCWNMLHDVKVTIPLIWKLRSAKT